MSNKKILSISAVKKNFSFILNFGLRFTVTKTGGKSLPPQILIQKQKFS